METVRVRFTTYLRARGQLCFLVQRCLTSSLKLRSLFLTKHVINYILWSATLTLFGRLQVSRNDAAGRVWLRLRQFGTLDIQNHCNYRSLRKVERQFEIKYAHNDILKIRCYLNFITFSSLVFVIFNNSYDRCLNFNI